MSKIERIGVAEAARRMGVSSKTVLGLAKAGDIPRGFSLDGKNLWTFDLKTFNRRIRTYKAPLPVAPNLRKPKWRKCSVYILGDQKMVKIGRSTQLERRIADIQAASPTVLTLFAAFGAALQFEGELHRRFAAYRMHGEWFRRDGDLAVWIKEGCPV